VDKAMDGICQLYENALKTSNPNKRKITYDISELFTYVDQIPDLTCLVYNQQLYAYTPHNKAWIKDRVFNHLKKQAQQAAQ